MLLRYYFEIEIGMYCLGGSALSVVKPMREQQRRLLRLSLGLIGKVKLLLDLKNQGRVRRGHDVTAR